MKERKKPAHGKLAFQLWFICYTLSNEGRVAYFFPIRTISKKKKHHDIETLQNWRIEEPAGESIALSENEEQKKETHTSKRIRISNANNLFVMNRTT